MYRTNYIANSRNIYKVLLVALVLFSLSLFSVFLKPATFLDVSVCLLLFAALVAHSMKNNITIAAFLIVSIAIAAHLLGSLGFYSYFIFGILGYDKIVHFTSSFSVGYMVLQSLPKRIKSMRYLISLLIVMGLGSLVEINEFIGAHYFGINNGGIFTMNDTLPFIKSDLQRFDTYFDMIFNFAGAMGALLFAKGQNYLPSMIKNIRNIKIAQVFQLHL